MNKTTKEQKALVRKKQDQTNRDKMFIVRGKLEILQKVFDSSTIIQKRFLVGSEFAGQNRTESEKWGGLTVTEKTESLISLIRRVRN